MPDSPPQQFDVHLFPTARLKIAGISASSPEEAIEIARGKMPIQEFDRTLRNFRAENVADAEDAEEFSHFLVDYVGDEDFERSRFFHCHAEPCLKPLQKLVEWFDAGRDEAALTSLVAEARRILNATV